MTDAKMEFADLYSLMELKEQALVFLSWDALYISPISAQLVNAFKTSLAVLAQADAHQKLVGYFSSL